MNFGPRVIIIIIVITITKLMPWLIIILINNENYDDNRITEYSYNTVDKINFLLKKKE